MPYYIVEPEVAGEIDSKFDNSTWPPVVVSLHYIFTNWLGDDIVESFPCFVISEQLAGQLSDAKMTGFSLDKLQATNDPAFSKRPRPFPEWKWLKVSGKAGTDDFGIGTDLRLVVSESALGILRSNHLQHAEISDA